MVLLNGRRFEYAGYQAVLAACMGANAVMLPVRFIKQAWTRSICVV